jgi:F-type H+-transporting ATPase subunit b
MGKRKDWRTMMPWFEKTTLFLFVLFMPLTAMAGDGGFTFNVHGFYIINAIVFVGLLYHFGKEPIHSFLVNRRNIILEELEEAGRLQAAAAARLTEYGEKINNLEEEKAQIKQAFINDGEREKNRILAEAEAAAKKLIEDTERQIDMEGKKIIRALEEEAVTMAVTMAVETAKERMNDDLQAKLVSDATASMESLPANELATSRAS